MCLYVMLRVYPRVQAEHSSIREVKNLAFKGISPFTEVFGEEFDLINAAVADLAHVLGTFVRDMYAIIGNNNAMQLTKNRLTTEHNFGRFTEIPLHWG